MTNTAQPDFSPIMQGDTGAPFAPQFTNKMTGKSVDLTGATISMLMQDTAPAGTVKAGVGTWHIDGDPTLGNAHYDYAANDVNTAGDWKLYIEITRSGKVVHADALILEILALPVVSS